MPYYFLVQFVLIKRGLSKKFQHSNLQQEEERFKLGCQLTMLSINHVKFGRRKMNVKLAAQTPISSMADAIVINIALKVETVIVLRQ